jgi:hypothetical protein
MPTIRVPLQIHSGHRWISPLKWEPWCLVCNAPAESEVSASLVNPNEFVFVPPLLFWSSEHFDVSYPVCMKHRRMCNLLDWPARRGPIVSFVCWLLLPAVVWLACIIGVTTFHPGLPILVRQVLGVCLAAALWSGMAFWYAVTIFVMPVRLSKLSRTDVTVTVRNRIAFLHIESANQAPEAPRPDQEGEKIVLSPPEMPRRRLQFERGPGRSDLS